ncbi:MAG TPA: hypothetical protein VF490_05350 [Chryseosolibacter sp.]
MRIEIRVVRSVCTVVVLLISLAAQGQDTVNVKPFERYWTKPRLVPKVGLGVEETAFAEIGIQLHKIYIHPLSLASAGPYFTVDGMIRDDQLVSGPKAGYEVTAGLLGLAADFTCYSDFGHEAFVFTPRAGLSIMGFVNLFYGINVPLSDYQFSFINKNRFSLVFNLNRDYFNLREAPRKERKSRP